ncbi:MAG TPA: WD40 repeat domain-containing protein [Gemmataceae bacterium]|nr:WD40 repeat domain-containing protein [Gemmataceae bacterium]
MWRRNKTLSLLSAVVLVFFAASEEAFAQPPSVLATLKSQAGAVNAIAFSPAGKLLASATSDNTTELWDINSTKSTAILKPKAEGPGSVLSVAISPDSKTVASGSARRISIWDVASKKTAVQFEVGVGAIRCIAFSPDGKILASTLSRSITLWDVANHKALRSIDSGQTQLCGLAFSPDGKMLASVSESRAPGQNNIKFWEVSSGKNTATIPNAQKFGVRCLAFAPAGKLLASAGVDAKDFGSTKNQAPPPLDSPWHDGEIKLWDLDTLKNTAILKGHTQTVYSVAFSPSGKWLASGSNDKKVKLWEVGSRRCLFTLEGHTERVLSVAFSPDGKTLASGSSDKTIKLWDLGPAKAK